jgi:hypothetical protein
MGDGNVYIGEEMVGAAAESNHTNVRNVKCTVAPGDGGNTVTLDLSTGLHGHASSSRRYLSRKRSKRWTSERRALPA